MMRLASIKSLSFRVSTCVRMAFASAAHDQMPSTSPNKMLLSTLMTIDSTMITGNCGMVRTMSVIIVSTASTLPPSSPEVMPTAQAINTAKIPAYRATISTVRVPLMNIAKISRPA